MPLSQAQRSWPNRRLVTTAFVDTPDIDPPPPPTGVPIPPAMPTTAKNSTWFLQWSQDFNAVVAEGQFRSNSPYSGATSTNDVGKGQFDQYLYPSYHDTRSKHHRYLTVTTTSGSPIVTSSNAFESNDVNRPYMESVAGHTTLPFTNTGEFKTGLRIMSRQSSSQVTMNQNASASGSYYVLIRSDFGFYDEKKYSVSGGICRLHMHTTSDGRHHVGALRPKVENGGTGKYNVLGGRFTLCMRVPQPLNGYKVAYLLWPESDTSNPDGELDFPEQDINGTGAASVFVHVQVRVPADKDQQVIGHSGVDIVDSNWHVMSMEWRPNHANPSASTFKAYMDNMVSPFFSLTGTKIPDTKMHWVWQAETNLNHATSIPDSTNGFIEHAWGTWERMI